MEFMELNLLNASFSAASTFAISLDERMKDYFHQVEVLRRELPKYREIHVYDYLDLRENVLGVLVAYLANGILDDICDGIAAYLDDAGIDHEGCTFLAPKGREDVLKLFAEILLREGAIDEIYSRDNAKFFDASV